MEIPRLLLKRFRTAFGRGRRVDAEAMKRIGGLSRTRLMRYGLYLEDWRAKDRFAYTLGRDKLEQALAEVEGDDKMLKARTQEIEQLERRLLEIRPEIGLGVAKTEGFPAGT